MKLVVGNWKMNPVGRAAAKALAEGVHAKTAGIKNVEVGVAPPAVYLQVVSEVLKGSHVGLGSQNIAWEEQGAFTGEISAPMLLELGGSFAIVGHSERRQLFRETSEIINQRLRFALAKGLRVILCVGETLKHREAELTQTILDEQLRGALLNTESSDLVNLIIAYEPVWAIGTGKVASPEQIAEAHAHVRRYVVGGYGEGLHKTLRILYGGSVTPENGAAIFAAPGVDGALVGGASLRADSFGRLAQLAA